MKKVQFKSSYSQYFFLAPQLGILLIFLYWPIIQTFKDAFTTYFISAVIGIAISVLFNILLFNFIDTEAKDTVQDNLIEFQVNMLKKFNTPTDKIKEAVEKMTEENQFDIVPQLKGSVFSILFSAIFGLILAAIFKSKPTYQE